MGWDINKVFQIGRLSNDVDLKYTNSGTAVAKFSIAVGGKPKPDKKETVFFFNVVVWGKVADNCNNYLKKGSKIAIDGYLQQQTWKGQDGKNNSRIEIIAERIEFLSTPKNKNENNSEPENSGFYEENTEEPSF